MSSLPQPKTNKHTFRRKANPNWVSQKLITGNTATIRVKFTLTKLQEDVSKNRAEKNYSDSENHINSQKKKQKKKHNFLQFRSMEARQIDNQRPSKSISN